MERDFLPHLIVTEKASVARTISKVLGVAARRDGYLDGGGWIVSWCVGHLVELEGAPYLLLGSQPGVPGCLWIVPWAGYPGPGDDLSARPGAVVLAPGARYSRTMALTVCL